uniref:RNA-dependent RNA polymerase n=1 Tax=Rosellinia necatrix partitivirus 26 TaxID=2759761 RepID=A0A7G4WLZ8_9VIRU|nr:RNA-dependent RNA polymerase [Rosellinia necatrix partitivirus 26]
MPAPNLRYIRTLLTRERPKAYPLKTTWLMDRTRRRAVLKAFYKYLPESIVDEVKNQRRSEYSDESLTEDFFKNEQPEINLNRDFHYRKALRVMTKLFKPKRNYKPVAFPDLRYYPWNLRTSAEAPYTHSDFWNSYLRNKMFRKEILDAAPSFHNLFDELFIKNRNLIHMIKDKHSAFFDSHGIPKPYYWVTLHARSHVVGPDEPDKIRAVFGVPKLLLFVENMFIWPMQADLLNRDPEHSPMMWGCEISRGGWKRLRRLIHKKTGSKFRTVLSADWSQFDRRALFSIIDDTHDIWHSFYDWDGSYAPTTYYPDAHTDPQRLQNLWDWFTHNVKYYPIALPNGDLYQWTRNGIASGYQETQLMDSWVNGIMLLTSLSELGVDIEHNHFFVKLQGDDSIACFSEGFFRIYGKQRFLSKLAEIALKRFNAKLSVDKSDVSDRLDGTYVLGYYNTSGLAWRTDVDLLSHLLFPERSQDLAATAATAVGIALASMGCSRVVYDICKDLFDFLTIDLGVVAKPDPTMMRQILHTHGGIYGFPISEAGTIMDFPSFDTCYFQNYVLDGRSETERERTWPTDPERSGGFAFL